VNAIGHWDPLLDHADGLLRGRLIWGGERTEARGK
jgi:hypothetical protein